ncbi:SigE family RNA polymerase sigma factor [Cryptosporangium aurantiacum]|uniref:RNA polymerase sigma-70 factor, sigma-E family n=1 Tax=Cryptosporangium aurantiacum TaxID=134849 RepID=A0A1M7RL51_9ACTN|nr:SigE family RNA polymerase sigma factor [Cryptosporangium aurantiacum]SHN46994.1 RNA polymerase sigma-70 factor, sigma-E family [Cryptosporangium aurantiacum]
MSTTGFDEYVAARGTALLRFAYLLTGDYHLAEDVLQEALAKVHGRWSRIADAERPTAYVQKAILRQYLSWRRRRSSTETPVAAAPEAFAPGSDHAEEFAQRDSLWHALEELPRQQRAVLVLRFYEDLDDAEISRLVGCSVTTVRSHASRGLARLRATITPVRGEAR